MAIAHAPWYIIIIIIKYRKKQQRVDTQEETVACATHNQVEDSVDGNHCNVSFFFVFCFFYETVRSYLNCRTYPDSFSKADKLALRKRAKYFCIKGADLYYVGDSSSKFTALVTESFKKLYSLVITAFLSLYNYRDR